MPLGMRMTMNMMITPQTIKCRPLNFPRKPRVISEIGERIKDPTIGPKTDPIPPVIGMRVI
jgi:hypothetical protein